MCVCMYFPNQHGFPLGASVVWSKDMQVSWTGYAKLIWFVNCECVPALSELVASNIKLQTLQMSENNTKKMDCHNLVSLLHYSTVLILDIKDCQYVFQLVEWHRRQFLNAKKQKTTWVIHSLENWVCRNANSDILIRVCCFPFSITAQVSPTLYVNQLWLFYLFNICSTLEQSRFTCMDHLYLHNTMFNPHVAVVKGLVHF